VGGPAVPDLLLEMAADQTALCASSAYGEMTLLYSSLIAD
jgi:hypothetical protein